MLRVELIYDADCPNVAAARAQLLRGFAAAGLTPRWREWERGDAASPHYIHAYGSPTVLVNGRDVADNSADADAACCRLYPARDGRFSGVPSVETLATALAVRPADHPHLVNVRLNTALSTLPAVGLALLPKLTCAACWPAYAGLLSALGLGFINFTPYLLPLTAVFLLLSLALLAYRARSRRGYSPLLLGVVAALIMMVGKFRFDSTLALYTGIALLIGAALWNSWPARKLTADPACPVCTPAGRTASFAGGKSTPEEIRL